LSKVCLARVAFQPQGRCGFLMPLAGDVECQNIVDIVYAGTVGLVKQSDSVTDISFDILSLQALFLVPR
jgi:hypothetical protein